MLSATALAITALKVGAVAHGDMQVAAGILSIRGWASVPSLLMTAVPYIVVVAVGLALLDLIERVRDRDELGGTPGALVVLVPLAALLGPRSVVLVGASTVLVMGVVSVLIRIVRRRRRPRRPIPSQSFTTVLAITAFGGLLFVATSPDPWLPKEQLQTTSGVSVQGYVLGDQGPMTAVLVDQSRQIEWIRTDAIQARTVCPQPIDDRPLLPSLVWRTEPAKTACAD